MVSLRSGARPLILHGLHSFFFRLQIAYVDGICIFKWPTIIFIFDTDGPLFCGLACI